MTFGERLIDLRTALGYSQKACSEKLGMETSKYNKWEKDKNRPDYETLVFLADFFDVSLDYLLGRSDNTKAEYGNISARLGLDNDAIESLEQIAKRRPEDPLRRPLQTLNYILKIARQEPEYDIDAVEKCEKEYNKYKKIHDENSCIDILTDIDYYLNFKFGERDAMMLSALEHKISPDELHTLDPAILSNWEEIMEQNFIHRIVNNLKTAKKHFQEQKGCIE